MGHLFVLEFSDGSIKIGHANTPGDVAGAVVSG
jgi:hypothetical protein